MEQQGTIHIGVTGWGDHDALYPNGAGAQDKLRTYASFFPIVELDSSFYAIQPERNMVKWVTETPPTFGFVVKAYQGMTGHQRGPVTYSEEETYTAFCRSIQPLVDAGKLRSVLFQFPPWFDCTRANVDLLRMARKQMGDLPLSLEFRNQTWFIDGMKERTLAFMRQEGWAHSICDEPQAGVGSVPTVLVPTRDDYTVVRMHGRNAGGWQNTGEANWRDVRYLYRYSTGELQEWADKLRQLAAQTKQVYVLFNNNSGGDAAANALEMAQLLGLGYRDLPNPPVQMDLF